MELPEAIDQIRPAVVQVRVEPPRSAATQHAYQQAERLADGRSDLDIVLLSSEI
jgi:hypothetical protein